MSVRVENLSFRYRQASQPALSEISLQADPGQVVLIAGPSGCGKSTLLRCLNGLIPHTYRGSLQGSVWIANQDTRNLTLSQIGQQVGTVLQDPERQIVASHVFEEVAFGLENLGWSVPDIVARVEETLRQLDLWPLAQRETHTLSGGEKQKLAIAGVLAYRPQVLLLDEPLANLDPASAQETIALCRQLADGGQCIIIIEHRVEEVLRLDPDHIVLMADGRVTYSGPVSGLGNHADPLAIKLPAPLALQLLAQNPPESWHPLPDPPGRKDVPLVELRGVRFSYNDRPALKGIDLQIWSGDRIGLLGPNGSGKSTLVKHLLGLLRPQQGEVWLEGRRLKTLSVAQAARQVGYVFQSPSHMLFAPSVAEEIAFGPRNLGQSEAEIEHNRILALDLLGLAGYEDRSPLTLSFGQQRRLCIASVIAMRSQILLLDEPTAGQDYRSTRCFMDGILRLQGFAAQVFITHDLDLAISYANRVILFADGQIVADGPPERILAQDELLHHCRLRPTSLLQENLGWLPRTGRFQRLEALATLRSASG